MKSMSMFRRASVLTGLLAMGTCLAQSGAQELRQLRGRLVDGGTGQPLAGRLYIEAADGTLYHARSADASGSAVEYNRRRSPQSVETHTTLSPHPFVADLPPGKYKLTAERGKEYLPAEVEVDLSAGPAEATLPLRRWIDMSSLGWYSGETHVHRSLEELPNAMLADDLNVALPLTYWVTRAYTAPGQGDKNSPPVAARRMEVDPTHVIYPLNTEYEIFTVGDKRHTLGAIFALNQRTTLQAGVPPVAPVAEQAHREGALLELDKHNWPWSMMLVPVMQVDLYELTNNHLWRADFFFTRFGESPPAYMQVEQNESGMTERGWIDFTFQNYYALLNCGFRLRPTGGTASGVHPVPLGFGRVYVHLPQGFSYEAWMQGLNEGHSFVTTGPMLAVTANDKPPGTTFPVEAGRTVTLQLQGWVRTAHRQSRIEIISAGTVLQSLAPANSRTTAGAYATELNATLELSESTWLAVRCFEELPTGRVRFAHSAPFHVDIAGQPLRPRRAEVDYLISRMKSELERNTGTLPDEALAEYRRALAIYEEIASRAR